MTPTVADRVRNHLAEAVALQALLTREAPALIGACLGAKDISLRELARQTGLSPTYLSEVWNKKKVISFGAYLKICETAR